MTITEALIGKNMKKHPEALGLYISLDEMYIAKTSRKDGSIKLESLLRVPVSAVDRSQLKPLELNESFFAMDNWLGALTKVAARKHWTNQKVVVSLSPSFSLLRHFVIPTQIERKHWKDAIPLQARKYIHFPFEKTMYSYHVYEFETAASKQKRLGVIFTITPKKIIDRLEKGLKSVGLDPVAIEPMPASLSRAFRENDKEAVDASGRIYSFFGNDMASFVFTNQNAPVLLREVEITGSLPVERRRFEITNCTEFIAKQLEKDPFEEAVIMGLNTDNWQALLEADSKKPVRKWNLSEVYGIETKSAGEIAAIGASMKFYDDVGPDLDYIKRNRLSDYEFNASVMAWKLVGVGVIILLLLLAKTWLGVRSDEKKLAEAKQQNSRVLDDFVGLSASQIQSNLSKMRTQNSSLESLLDDSNTIAPLLADIVSVIPDKIWITKLSYQEDFLSKTGGNRSLVFEGSIQTGNSEEDLVLGKTFYDKIIAQPAIDQLCGAGATIEYKEVASNESGRTLKTGGAPNTKETSFTFTCNGNGVNNASGRGNNRRFGGAKGGFAR